MVYSMLRYWSIVHGTHVARLSLTLEGGGELFVIVPQDGSGAQNRAKKTRGLDILEEALAAGGAEPGELTYTEGVE